MFFHSPRDSSPLSTPAPGQFVTPAGPGFFIIRIVLLLAAIIACHPIPSRAQQGRPGLPQATPAPVPQGRPNLLQDVGIDQKLNGQLPLDLTFRDETGRPVQLREYFGKKAVLLSLVYYECPMLCTMILNGLVTSLRAVPLTVGNQFEVVTVSIDPREKPELAAGKKEIYLRRYDRAGAAKGWHFLTGEEANIRQLAKAAGFRYAWDPLTKQYAHGSAVMIATPQGRLSRYFYGIEYSARDIRLGLVEASANKIGSLADQVLLFCYHYDPATGKYGLVIMNLVRAAGLATVLALGCFMFVMFRRDLRNKVSV